MFNNINKDANANNEKDNIFKVINEKSNNPIAHRFKKLCAS